MALPPPIGFARPKGRRVWRVAIGRP